MKRKLKNLYPKGWDAKRVADVLDYYENRTEEEAAADVGGTDLFTGIEHLALAARDPERLVQWYVVTLDFHVRTTLDSGPGKPRAYLIESGSGSLIEVYAADQGKCPTERQNADQGLAHIAILVSNFDAAQARLDKAGVRSEGAGRAAPLGARVRFYRDPEGNLFHILFRPKPL
ncbi:MAG: VOC family protein [Planctomycetota bacterium]